MARGSATDFLIQTVLDEAFRELAMADPQRAFEGYDLSEEEQEILRSRDSRLLGLLGKAAGRGEVLVEHPAEEGPAQTAASGLPSLPEVKLLLRLAPHAPKPPESTSEFAYAASLHPWPGDQGPEKASAESGRRSKEHDAELAWIIRITPTVVEAQETGLKVAYSASIHPFAVGTDEKQPSAHEPSQAPPRPPWNHHVESSAAKAAARAVRESDASQRYERLLELIHALQTGNERG